MNTSKQSTAHENSPVNAPRTAGSVPAAAGHTVGATARVIALAALVASGSALAAPPAQRGYGPAETFGVQARVLDVEPLVRTVQVTVPQEVCWQEPVRHSADNYTSHTPKVIGGIIGGVVGNQFGGGSGKKIMTAAGALLGASIGRDAQYRNRQPRNSYVSYEQVCEVEQVTHEEQRTDGYRVVYEYGGREFVTYRDVPPGDYIRLQVHVEPVG